MKTAPPPRSSERGWLRAALLVVLLGIVMLPLVLGVGLVACFLPGGEVKALRHCVADSAGGRLDRQIEFAVRAPILALARVGLSFADLPAEARAALRTLRGAEVGIYQLPSDGRTADRSKVLPHADDAMARRGWERLVGVVDGQNIVAVYTPQAMSSARDLRFAVLVFDPSQVVVATVRGDAEPLLKLAFQELARHTPPRLAANFR